MGPHRDEIRPHPFRKSANFGGSRSYLKVFEYAGAGFSRGRCGGTNRLHTAKRMRFRLIRRHRMHQVNPPAIRMRNAQCNV